MGCAIVLAVALFPRRGDKLRPETTPLYEKLSFTVAKMIPAAEVAHLPPNVGVGFYKPISDAQAVFQ